jgi:hypothetical protein
MFKTDFLKNVSSLRSNNVKQRKTERSKLFHLLSSLLMGITLLIIGGSVLCLAILFVTKSALQLKEFKGLSIFGWALSKQSPSDVFTNLVRQDPNLKFLKLCLPGSPGLIAVHPESAKVIPLIKRCNF